jgi:serine/threonine-protein kinase
MSKPPIQIGRYALYDELARGGMATVHLGRLVGPAGFARTVAIKRLHPHLATDPSFVAMLLDEARLAARIQHPNVAATLDVVAKDGELFVVMEYLNGETLSRLLRTAKARGQRVPPAIAVAIAIGALTGLHAAHEARGETGDPLGLVHRDISPQNVMVRRDGTAVVVDFGVAKAAGRFHVTEEGQIKGKLPYMATEQVRGQPLTRRVDVYAASAVLWETLVGERLVKGSSEAEVLEGLLFGTLQRPGSLVDGIAEALDAAVMKGLSRRADDRWATAQEMALALEDALTPATPARVAAWLEDLVGDTLRSREHRVSALETGTASLAPIGPEEALRLAIPMAPTPSSPAPQIAAETATDATTTKIASPAPDAAPASATAPAPSESTPVPPAPDPGTARMPAPRSRSRAWLGAPIAIVVAGAVVFVRLTHGSNAPASPTEASAAPSAIATPVATAASTSAEAPAPAASAPASATAVPQAPAHVAPKRPPSPAPTAPRAAPDADCAVPYTIDGSGKRIYKRKCL